MSIAFCVTFTLTFVIVAHNGLIVCVHMSCYISAWFLGVEYDKTYDMVLSLLI